MLNLNGLTYLKCCKYWWMFLAPTGSCFFLTHCKSANYNVSTSSIGEYWKLWPLHNLWFIQNRCWINIKEVKKDSDGIVHCSSWCLREMWRLYQCSRINYIFTKDKDIEKKYNFISRKNVIIGFAAKNTITKV